MVRVDNENFRLQKGIAALAVLLLFVKLVAYFMTNSTAILTDVMETTVNVVAAFIGLFALYLSAQPADHSHPFGHGKVELISALIEGSMITIAGILMIYESVESLFNPREISDLGIGILLIIAAGVANYIVGMVAIRRGKRNMSPALVASGRHLMSDTYVAVGIILGLTVVFLAMNAGYDARWLDSTIALVFSLFIVATGIKVIKESMDDLMDKADEALLSSLSESLKSHRHSDWVDLFGLRIMKHGNIVYADFHIILPRDMTVEDVARETDELQTAITGTMGPDVEIAVTPIPCESRHCIHCDKECGMRASEFIGQIEWDMETMTSDAPQSSERRCVRPSSFYRGHAIKEHGPGNTPANRVRRIGRLVCLALRPRQGQTQEISRLGSLLQGGLPVRGHAQVLGGPQLQPLRHRGQVRRGSPVGRFPPFHGQGRAHRRSGQCWRLCGGKGPVPHEPGAAAVDQGRAPGGQRRGAAQGPDVQEPADRHHGRH